MKKLLFILLMTFASTSIFAQISPTLCPQVTHCITNINNIYDPANGDITVCQSYASCSTDPNCGCGSCAGDGQCMIRTLCEEIPAGGMFCFQSPTNGDVQLTYTFTVTIGGTDFSHTFMYMVGTQEFAWDLGQSNLHFKLIINDNGTMDFHSYSLDGVH